MNLTRKISTATILLAAVIELTMPRAAVAHPISLSSAVINVRDDGVRVELNIMLEDLVLYYRISAKKDLRFRADDLKQAAKKHHEFLLKYFVIRDANGERVPGKVASVDTQQIPAIGALQAELMKKTLTYILEFPLDSPQKFLTFTQTFGGLQAVLPAVMDCMILQNEVLLETSTQLTAAQPYIVKFDWKNPPKQSPRSWKELRAKKQEQFRQRLGITSYSSLHSYIYITDYEVRHEILVPLLSFETWMKIERRNPEFLDIDEQDAARKRIEAFFRDRNPVNIDGVSVKPVLARLNFFGLDINDFAVNAKPRRISVYHARLGIILSYSTKGTPGKVGLQWNTFNKYAPFLRSIVYVHDELPREFVFRKDGQRFEWTVQPRKNRRAKIKPVAVGLTDGQTTKIDSEQAHSILMSLLKNIYRAFDYRRDSDIYDALAQSVDGELLPKLYLKFKRSLLMAEQGGTRARVKEVKRIGGKLTDVAKQSRFIYECRWQVTGTIEHWGHIHTRVNEYVAKFTVTATQHGWKITKYEILDQKRVRFETGLRMAGDGGTTDSTDDKP